MQLTTDNGQLTTDNGCNMSKKVKSLIEKELTSRLKDLDAVAVI